MDLGLPHGGDRVDFDIVREMMEERWKTLAICAQVEWRQLSDQ